jgi:hypothetical protein
MNIQVDKEDLTKVLILLLTNSNTSASREGLEFRKKNRDEAIKELLFMLNLTTEEATELYLNSLK